MARRRTYRTHRRTSKGDAAALAALFGLIAALVTACFWVISTVVRWYIGRWHQADRRGRTILAGGLIGTLIVLCGLGALSNTTPQSNSFAASVSSPQAGRVAVVSATESAPSAVSATALPSPTTVPPTPTAEPTPPVGHVIKDGNLRSEPRIVPETVLGQLCSNDQIAYISQQLVDANLWYRVRVIGRAKDCSSKQVAIGTEGWASTILVSDPSYSIEEYAKVANLTLPTAIIFPTETPRPTAMPKPTPRPTAVPAVVPAVPASGGVRVGAICRDGSRSYATGRGACSHHGGVDHWLYQ
jgi:hypothetical protein